MLRDFLRTIQSQAAAGDPAVVGTVRVLADLLEERGDVRAAWIAGIVVKPWPFDYWLVEPPQIDCQRIHASEASALRELARRVLAAMTRECPYCSARRWVGTENARFKCPACHGDGWLLTEAEACGCNGECVNGWWVPRQPAMPYRDFGDSPIAVQMQRCDCGGKGWRAKEAATR